MRMDLELVCVRHQLPIETTGYFSFPDCLKHLEGIMVIRGRPDASSSSSVMGVWVIAALIVHLVYCKFHSNMSATE